MAQLTETLYGYLIDGNMRQFWIQLLNYYFPFALFFWLVAAAIFGIIHMKTQNMAYSGAVVAMYLMMISSSGYVVNAYSEMIMRIVGMLIGLIAGYYIYRSFKG